MKDSPDGSFNVTPIWQHPSESLWGNLKDARSRQGELHHYQAELQKHQGARRCFLPWNIHIVAEFPACPKLLLHLPKQLSFWSSITTHTTPDVVLSLHLRSKWERRSARKQLCPILRCLLQLFTLTRLENHPRKARFGCLGTWWSSRCEITTLWDVIHFLCLVCYHGSPGRDWNQHLSKAERGCSFTCFPFQKVTQEPWKCSGFYLLGLFWNYIAPNFNWKFRRGKQPTLSAIPKRTLNS